MGDGHRLVQAMRKAAQPPQNEIVDIVVGEVTSVKPLKVKIENRELTESFLILGALCKETSIRTHDDIDVVLWRGLRVGDRVFMLKVGRGQKYYIIQRQEGVIPT